MTRESRLVLYSEQYIVIPRKKIQYLSLIYISSNELTY